MPREKIRMDKTAHSYEQMCTFLSLIPRKCRYPCACSPPMANTAKKQRLNIWDKWGNITSILPYLILPKSEFIMSQDFLSKLEQASLFELWRLRTVIDKYMEDPYRLMQVRAKLRLGQKISYFAPEENREIQGVITQIKQTCVVVKQEHDQKHWNISFYMLNIDCIPTDIKTNHKKVDRLTLKVGDKVGFVNHRDNNKELYGTVVKLNPKTAGVKLNTGEHWRVGYGGLFYVLDGEEEIDATLIERIK